MAHGEHIVGIVFFFHLSESRKMLSVHCPAAALVFFSLFFSPFFLLCFSVRDRVKGAECSVAAHCAVRSEGRVGSSHPRHDRHSVTRQLARERVGKKMLDS